jgi:hypothetical protein
MVTRRHPWDGAHRWGIRRCAATGDLSPSLLWHYPPPGWPLVSTGFVAARALAACQVPSQATGTHVLPLGHNQAGEVHWEGLGGGMCQAVERLRLDLLEQRISQRDVMHM